MSKPVALIVGVGDGLSASLARLLHQKGYQLALAARNIEKLAGLGKQTSATLHQCNASDIDSVGKLFDELDSPLRVAVYNPSAWKRGPLVELDPKGVRHSIEVTAFGAFLVGQQATRKMLLQEPENGVKGTILFTGASAGVKGFPESAPFAMGKFAQRGLSESMSRELHPQGVHVAWINIDGGIASSTRGRDYNDDDRWLDPDSVARAYLGLIEQDRTAWSSELAIRPWVETF